MHGLREKAFCGDRQEKAQKARTDIDKGCMVRGAQPPITRPLTIILSVAWNLARLSQERLERFQIDLTVLTDAKRRLAIGGGLILCHHTLVDP